MVRESEGTIIERAESVQQREGRSIRGVAARLLALAAVGMLFYCAGVTAFGWHAASQRNLEVIKPWKHHWDLMFYAGESSSKLAWAAAAALLSVLVKPSRSNVGLLVLCVALWLVHFMFHIGLIT